MKCDVIIPIYNSLEWVKLCIYALYQNTNKIDLGEVILINDKSNRKTTEYLRDISKKYFNIVLIENKKNLGFVKSCNYGMSISKSDYVLLLNSDCVIAKNVIHKLLVAMNKDKTIGLMCPISSKAANLSFPLPDGYNYQMLNHLFEEKFSGKTFDACTVVGNCLMISKKCIETVGYFDEIFDKGYTEETDYQFKAESYGFKAKVLIDSYVFHECRVSFGESKKQLSIRDEHLKIFFDRWGEQYQKKMNIYKKHDPIEYIYKHLKKELGKKYIMKKYKNMFFCQMDARLIEHINYLIINDKEIVIGNLENLKDEKIMLFSLINNKSFGEYYEE